MAAPILVPSLVTLRNEFNALNPARDRESDGWIGDRAHALRPSDHNPDETGATPFEDADHVDEVHGLDVDHTGPWPRGQDMGAYTREIAARHRLGLDDRLQNIIYAGQIASRSWGWTWQPYNGSNGHYEHAHFSARYEHAHENNTKPYGLLTRFLEEDFDLNTNEMNQLADKIAEAILTTKVRVGDEQWTVGSCIGYQARKAYETDQNTDGLEPALTGLQSTLNKLAAAVVRLGQDDQPAAATPATAARAAKSGAGK